MNMNDQPMTPNTYEDLVDLLRACPAEHLPAPPDVAADLGREPAPLARGASAMGTPRARTWDEEWLDAVDAAEARIGRRICGARTISGRPCEMGTSHPSGRCRFHGGFDLTGAPKGNRYAYLHGLYSRRLKTCGAHCPAWSSCPCAGADVEAAAAADRPVCPYEQAQYDTALADALDLAQGVRRPDAFHIHTAHNVALLQVMLDRAAVEMRNVAVVSEMRAPSGDYSFTQLQVSPYVNAMGRIGSELRKNLALLNPGRGEGARDAEYDARRRALREAAAGPAAVDFQAVAPDPKEVAREREGAARRHLTEAVTLAARNQLHEALEMWSRAQQADGAFTSAWTGSLRKRIRAQQRSQRPPQWAPQRGG